MYVHTTGIDGVALLFSLEFMKDMNKALMTAGLEPVFHVDELGSCTKYMEKLVKDRLVGEIVLRGIKVGYSDGLVPGVIPTDPMELVGLKSTEEKSNDT